MLDVKNEYFPLSGSALTLKEKGVIRLLLTGYDVMTWRAEAGSVKTVSSQKPGAYKKPGVRGDIGLFPALIKRRGMQVICGTDGYLSTTNTINIRAGQAG